MYTVIVKFYDGSSNKKDKIEVKYCFVSADSLKEVIEVMEYHYGRDNIVEITIADLSPDCFLEFDEDLADMFYDVRDTLISRVIW